MVKCADCGFLGVRVLETRELVDAEYAYRAQGILPHKSGQDQPLCDPCPVCFAAILNDATLPFDLPSNTIGYHWEQDAAGKLIEVPNVKYP